MNACKHPQDKIIIVDNAPYCTQCKEIIGAPLAELLDGVRGYIRQYVVLTDHQSDAITLWTAHTHALDAAESTPYLSVTSAEKRSGKTRLLEVLDLLVSGPWMTGRTSAAALYRRIAAEGPTLLLDESDSAFRSGEEYAETLRGVLNTGHRRGGSVTVCIGSGANMTYGVFSTFSAKCIAGIGRLPDTVADRSISIVLKRKAPGEKAARFKPRKAREAAAPLKEKLVVWAGTSEGLREAEPDIPEELDDRAADGWEILIGIADAAGGEWPERARKAALELSVGDSREDDSLGVRLLADIRDIFDEKKVDRLTCAKLASALVGLEEAPWADIRGRSLDTRRLGWRLKPFGIRSRTIRIGDDSTPKGYLVEQFVDEWARYLPPVPLEKHTQHTQPPQTPDTDTGDVAVVTDVAVSRGAGKQVAESPDEDIEQGWVSGLQFDDDDPLKDKRVRTWTLAVRANFPHLPGVVERASRDTYAAIAQRDKEPWLDTVISALEAHLAEVSA